MIVVTTATGNIGSKVLEQLVKAGEKVRVLVRDPSKLPLDIQSKIDVVQGSLDDAEDVAKAYKGAEQVFFIVPPSMAMPNVDDYYRNFGKITTDAVRAQGVKRVLYVSGTGLQYVKNSGPVSAAVIVEEQIDASPAASKILHCGTFMENLFHSSHSIKAQSGFSTSVPGDVKIPWVATQDIADKSVKLLLDRSWSGKGSVGVLGPEDLSYNEIALKISKALGRDIEYKAISDESLKARLKQFGSSESAAQGLVDIYTSMADGRFNRIQRSVETSSPTKFEDWFEKSMRSLVTLNRAR